MENTPTREQIKDKIVAVLEQVAEIDLAGVDEDARLAEELEMNSLDAMNVFTELEEAFDIELTQAEIMRLSTLKEIVDHIHAMINEK